MQVRWHLRFSAPSVTSALLLGLLLSGFASTVGAQGDPDELPRNLLTLHARFDPALTADEVEVEVLGRRFRLGPNSSLGIAGLPIGTNTVTVTDVDPDLLELTDVQCRHLDYDPLEWEADLAAGSFRLSLDADDGTVCELFFSAPTYVATIAIVADPPDLAADIGVGVDGLDPLTIPTGTSETVELRVRPGGQTAAVVLTDADGLLPGGVDCATPDGSPEGITIVGTRRAELALPADSAVTCTFSLGEVPPATVVATVETDPAFTEGEIDVEMGGVTVRLGHGEFATDRHANPDRYPLVVDPGPEFWLRSLACVDTSGGSVPITEGDTPGAVMLEPTGDTTMCTIVISPRVATVRFAIDAGDRPVETQFTLELGAGRVELRAGEVVSDPSADPGRYRAALIPDQGFRLDDIVCSGTDGERLSAAVVFENQSIAFAPGIGASVDCTFLLTPRSGIVETVVTADPILPDTRFRLELGSQIATVAAGVTATDDEARAGTYRLSLLPVPRYRLLDIACRDSVGDRVPADFLPESQAASFALPIGDTIRCEVIVEARVGTVGALVDDGAPEGENSYELDMFGVITTVGSQIETTDDLADAAGYSIALLPHDGAALADIACRDRVDERIAADVDFENRSVTFAPGIGGQVRCTFVLGEGSGRDGDIGSGGSGDAGAGPSDGEPTPDDPGDPDASAAPTDSPLTGDEPPIDPIVPRAGAWSVVNRPATIACAGQVVKLPRTTDRGRIQVRRRGDRLIAVGLGEEGGRSRIVLDRVGGDPSVYVGSTRISRQGTTFSIGYRMVVRDPKRIAGTLSGDFKAGGARCRLSREFAATFAGS